MPTLIVNRESCPLPSGAPLRQTPAPALFRQYGVALDVGTTTLAARLYGTEGLLAQACAPNPQRRYGADVISRIGKALEGEGALTVCVRAAIAALLREMAATASILPEQVDAMVITGNTAMLYLLTGRSPGCLSHAPFDTDTHFDLALTGEALELPCPGASVYLPPCISAFIGADVTTALLAVGVCRKGETTLLADIGTNGEMALWHRGRLTCCSTAAGPAFEGTGLSMGMPGEAGAIDHVSVQHGGLTAHTIGEVPPTGICGSGAVSAIAALLATEQMDDGGRLDRAPVSIAPPVVFTQRDMRTLQLAKSAVRSGIDALLDSKKLACRQVSALAIAGGFGSGLDVRSAAAIGLIPPLLAEKTHIWGNAALAGAAMVLHHTDLMEAARFFTHRAKVLDLNKSVAFSHHFVDNMMF